MNPRAVLDVRVRQALAHGVDKQTFSETVWGGELKAMDSIFDPTTDYYPVIDRAITKYPYDPRTSERLMQAAGYTRGPDGYFASPEGALSLVLEAPQDRTELPVLASNWRQAGFDMQQKGLPLRADSEVRSTYPGLSIGTSGAYENQQMSLYRLSEVSSAETRWLGVNNSGWKNPAYDRLVDAFDTTLDPNERIKQRAQIAHMLSEELPSIVLTYNANAHAYLASVKGITRSLLYTTGRIGWNIEHWELQ
jgi:peptide/nickel transport system substrate-binding protein